MTRFFLETPFYLILVVLVVWSAAFIWWRWKRTQGAMVLFAALLILGMVAVTINLVVTTDREIAGDVLAHLIRDVERERLPAALTYLSVDFNDGAGTNYAALEKGLKGGLSKLTLSDIQIGDVQAERTSAGNIQVRFTAQGLVTLVGPPRQFGPDHWDVVLAPLPGSTAWKIISARLTEARLAGAPEVGNLCDIFGLVPSKMDLNGW